MLQKEVIPEFKILQDINSATGSIFLVILQEAVNTLCKNLSWMKELTTKQRFCWGLVASCCSKINISHENLDWVHSYDKVLKTVGYIYNVYCSGRRLAENQCIIIEQLPKEVAKHPNEDVIRYTVIHIHTHLTCMCMTRGNVHVTSTRVIHAAHVPVPTLTFSLFNITENVFDVV